MNKLILIGNGFDLAHGLKTSYQNFIDDYWEQKVSLFKLAYERGKLPFGVPGDFSDPHHFIRMYQDDDIKIDKIPYAKTYRFDELPKKYGYENFIQILKTIDKSLDERLSYKNQFLKQITQKTSLENWVDIEAEYFSALKKCSDSRDSEAVKKLNEDFSVIQKALEKYLMNQTENSITIPESNMERIYSVVSNKILMDRHSPQDSTMFLNFNYTSTIEMYISRIPSEFITTVNYIHGKLREPNNPVIFGYGDERGDDYMSIKEKNVNGYLDNIKSIKYQDAGNYTKLMDFIKSKIYSISIIGHSCGISDRTLLNVLFEHKNCTEINVYYHKKADGTDDYKDKIENISRIFTNDDLRLARVTDKTKCEPLLLA
jgi:hypothetical protein